MTVIVTTYLALVLTIIRRDRRRIRDSAGSLCPRCGYDLRALPPSGPCPECGTPYTIDDVRRLWARTFHLPPAPTTPATPATPPNNHTDP